MNKMKSKKSKKKSNKTKQTNEKQSTEWKKIFSDDVTNKGLISKIYKLLRV